MDNQQHTALGCEWNPQGTHASQNAVRRHTHSFGTPTWRVWGAPYAPPAQCVGLQLKRRPPQTRTPGGYAAAAGLWRQHPPQPA
eukprot:1158042-Pelagomonas_calceolata.AAC.2